MTIHRLTARLFVPRPLPEVFAFFERPENLARITPTSMRLEFLSDDFRMRDGLEIVYRMRPLLGVPVTWRTRIASYNPPFAFHDSQSSGPYRRWEHTHRFEADVDGNGTWVEDEVEYQLPFGPLGGLAHRFVVKRQLRRIFENRGRVIAGALALRGTNPAPLRVAVAGGTGFVGGAIASELFRRGEDVAVLSHRGEAARGELPDEVALRRADVRTSAGLEDALRDVDVLVISLAFPNLPIEAPRQGATFDEVDAAGTQRLVDAAIRAGVRRLVYLSGAGAALDAKRHWFRAKARAEQSVRESGIPFTIIRPTWIYGPRDVALNRFVGFARTLGMVPLTNLGRQPLAPVFVGDVAALAADAIRDERAIGQTFEIGGPETLSMREIVATALRVAGLRRPIVPTPTFLIKLAAWPLSLFPRPLITPAAIDFINQPAVVDTAPLLARMPRRLTPLAEGLATYLSPGSSPGVVSFDAPRPRPIPVAIEEGL